MKQYRLAIGTLAVLSLLAGSFRPQERAFDEGAALKDLAPTSVFTHKTGDPLHYRLPSGDVAFNSYDIEPSLRGYAGPIKVMIVLGQDGRLKGIKILEHRETRNYVHYMETPAYLGRFVGKSVLDRFEVDRDIDGISRATVSVQALVRTVRDSSRAVAREVFGIQAAGAAGGRPQLAWISYAVLFLVALGGYYASRGAAPRQRLRDAVLLAGFGIIGVVLSAPFSILHVFNLLLFRPSTSLLWSVVVGSTLLSVLLAGRFYCGWLCPFGAVSELLARIPVRKWTIDARTDARWRSAKYALLALATTAVLLFRRSEYGNYETYVTLFSGSGSAFAWCLVAVSLLANPRVPRFWCRYLCPVAALLGLLSRKTEGYPGSPACPMGNKRDPEISECIRCNRCYHRTEGGVTNSGQTGTPGHGEDPFKKDLPA